MSRLTSCLPDSAPTPRKDHSRHYLARCSRKCAVALSLACMLLLPAHASQGESAQRPEGDSAVPVTVYESAVQAALLAAQRGDYSTAYAIWQSLARKGDDKAAVEAGLMHHMGQGMPVDYAKAMDWYLEAFDRNGDAFNNIGVMHRDGLGVPRNRKIAYLLFLTVHMMGLGSDERVMRANENLRGELAELPLEDRHEALCYTLPYVEAYVKSRGALEGIPPHVRASSERRRIRDLRWWAPGEVGEFQCPPGT